jgi:hypothetical protein
MTAYIKSTIAAVQLLCLSLFSLALTASEEMEIFELKGKTLDEMIPLIQPFVGPEGTVTGMHNQLIVRTTSERMTEVRRILDQFDRPPRRLLIHVRETNPINTSEKGFEISTHNERVKIGRPGETGIRLKHYDTRENNDSVRTIQALEGSPTLILSGSSQPFVSGRSFYPAPYPNSHTEYQYRNIDSGFYATAHLIGDRVRIEITTQRENLLQDRQTINRRESQNSVSGKLGNWIPLANINTKQQQREADIAKRKSTRFEESETLWVKVELLP